MPLVIAIHEFSPISIVISAIFESQTDYRANNL